MRCAISIIRCTGLTVPSAFETCATATIFVRGPEQLCKFIEQQLALVVDGSDAQPGAFFFAQNLPGHDVGVVLHGGDQHFVAGADMCAARRSAPPG